MQPGIIVGLVGEDDAVLRRDGEYEQRDGHQSCERRGKQNGDFVPGLQVVTDGAPDEEHDRGGSHDGKRLDRDSREQAHHSDQFGNTDKAAEP